MSICSLSICSSGVRCFCLRSAIRRWTCSRSYRLSAVRCRLRAVLHASLYALFASLFGRLRDADFQTRRAASFAASAARTAGHFIECLALPSYDRPKPATFFVGTCARIARRRRAAMSIASAVIRSAVSPALRCRISSEMLDIARLSPAVRASPASPAIWVKSYLIFFAALAGLAVGCIFSENMIIRWSEGSRSPSPVSHSRASASEMSGLSFHRSYVPASTWSIDWCTPSQNRTCVSTSPVSIRTILSFRCHRSNSGSSARIWRSPIRNARPDFAIFAKCAAMSSSTASRSISMPRRFLLSSRYMFVTYCQRLALVRTRMV